MDTADAAGPANLPPTPMGTTIPAAAATTPAAAAAILKDPVSAASSLSGNPDSASPGKEPSSQHFGPKGMSVGRSGPGPDAMNQRHFPEGPFSHKRVAESRLCSSSTLASTSNLKNIFFVFNHDILFD